MSIVQNGLVTGLAGAEPGPYPFQTDTRPFTAAPAATDAVSYGPGYGFGGGFAGEASEGPTDLYGGSSSGSTGLGNFGNVMNGIMNMLASALGSLSGMVGGSSTSGGGSPSQWPGSTAAGSLPQQYFANATASSVGDPHDAFDGTTARGTSISNAWDDMNARPDLLASDSFAGGYRVSTTDTAPQANGVTYNSSATVSTDYGATKITMEANGSYQVTERGQNVTLAQGQAVPLDGTETVTLGADGSLAIADANASGGSITTTLASNGDGGVDVKTTAHDVDLGGYLVGRTDPHAGDGGHAYQPGPAGPPLGPPSRPPGEPWPIRFPLGTMTAQGSGDLGDLTQLLASD
jgi:hypothetical protein